MEEANYVLRVEHYCKLRPYRINYTHGKQSKGRVTSWKCILCKKIKGRLKIK